MLAPKETNQLLFFGQFLFLAYKVSNSYLKKQAGNITP